MKSSLKLKSLVIFLLAFFIAVGFCTVKAAAQQTGRVISNPPEIKTGSLELFDQKRNRRVPVAIYFPARQKNSAQKKRLKLAILNHGYGMKNTDYSFIAETLAARGYFVAGIQHELSTDEPMPTVGKPSEVRRPFWERGVQNILFVIEELKRTKPELDFKNLLLAGHSNGGDTVMLFAQKYPKLARKIITLDNRRMALPRAKRPQILSIRSSDQPADKGVLPDEKEQKTFGIKIVKLPNTIHNDMWDGATDAQKREINDIISEFL